MRIALIGLGDIAQKAHLPLLASDERVTLLLCTRSPSVLGKLARQYRIAECFTELGDLLASRPDAVMIHATTSVHFALAEQCLRAGIPTFVDKPLCFDYAEAGSARQSRHREGLPALCGFQPPLSARHGRRPCRVAHRASLAEAQTLSAWGTTPVPVRRLYPCA